MKTSDFDFELPKELIAQYPVKRRGSSRLMVVDKGTGEIQHRKYSDIPDYLEKEDVVVLNRTKVMKARVFCRVKRTGKHVEVLFLEQTKDPSGSKAASGRERWHCLIGRAKQVMVGDELQAGGHSIFVEERVADDPGFFVSGIDCRKMMESHGVMPLPPYIRRELTAEDESRYNTVFAQTQYSAAAPTASLNLTDVLLSKMRKNCSAVCSVDLHIGLGTFRPIDTERVEDYKIHTEYISVPDETVGTVNACSGRVWAFGTTVVRTLESAAISQGKIHTYTGETDLFIYPGYSFNVVDVLVTNFHMPRTSLIALVSAFAGTELIANAYKVAIKEGYRFLSYGDSMLIMDTHPRKV